MTNSKNTKKALFSSMIALILCCSMLIGTTFAWFTDSVSSGINVIAAGNLDVDVYYGDPKERNSIQDQSFLFDEIKLWEPGVVAYENLTVVNLGNLALKYRLRVNFTEATTNDNGESLARVLKVGIVPDGIPEGTGREDALLLVNEWIGLEDFEKSGELREQDAFSTYGIVIYWEPSEVDNDFNMRNDLQGRQMSVNLGVTLMATQLPKEEDSFGDGYDTDAYYPGEEPPKDPDEEPGMNPDDDQEETREVSNLDELQDALANGGSIRLMENIAVSEALTITTDVKLDLNNHTLSGTTDDAILIVYAGNVSIDDTSEDAKGAIVNHGTGTAVYVDGSASMVATMSLTEDEMQDVASTTPTLTLEGGALRAGDHGLLAVGATVIIKNGTVSGKHGVSVQYANIVISGGKLIGTGYGLQAIGATVEITHGNVTGDDSGMYMEGADITVLGGTTKGTKYGMIIKDAHVKIIGGTLTGSVDKDENTEVTITGGHFSDDAELKAAGVEYQSYEMDGQTHYVVGPKTDVYTLEQLNEVAGLGGLAILQNDFMLETPMADITKDLVLHMNGHVIDVPEECFDQCRKECGDVHFTTIQGAHVVVIDNENNDGGIRRDHSEAAFHVVDGKLVIAGGSYEGTPTPFVHLENSELYVYSGSFGIFDVSGDVDSIHIHGGLFSHSMSPLDAYLNTDVYTGYYSDDYYQVVPIPVIKSQSELQDALGKYGKIILGANIETDEPLTATADLWYGEALIDLNGYTISGSFDDAAVLTVSQWGQFALRIANGSIVNTGEGPGVSLSECECEVTVDVDVTGGNYGIYAENCDNIHINGTVTGTYEGLRAINVNNLNVNSSVTGGNCGMYLDVVGNASTWGATITGGNYGIYAVNDSHVTTNKSSITGDTAVYLDENSTVNGGTVFIPSEPVSATPVDSLQNGDKVVIYHPETVYAIGSGATGTKLAGEGVEFAGDQLNSDTAASWTVSVDENGYYSFTCHGLYLTSGATGNSLTLEETPNAYSLWILEAVEGGWYIKNANATYNGSAQYLQYYNGFTTYGFKENTSSNYLFRFYTVTE